MVEVRVRVLGKAVDSVPNQAGAGRLERINSHGTQSRAQRAPTDPTVPNEWTLDVYGDRWGL